LRVDLGLPDSIHAIAPETWTRGEPARNLPGTFELAHLNQVAASSALSTGTAASAGAWAFGEAGAKPVAIRIFAARKLKNHAVDFEAEPEEEFLVQAQ
jgi:hypothetical protein